MGDIIRIPVLWSFVDQAHFFTSSDGRAQGLCVTGYDFKIALRDVPEQLHRLYRYNWGRLYTFQLSGYLENQINAIVSNLISIHNSYDLHRFSRPALVLYWEGRIVSRAPWTLEQVVNLNAYQRDGLMHPFTCPNDGKDLHATTTGWICPGCNYTQEWAHDFMLNWNSAEHRAQRERLFGLK